MGEVFGIEYSAAIDSGSGNYREIFTKSNRFDLYCLLVSLNYVEHIPFKVVFDKASISCAGYYGSIVHIP